MTVLCVRKTTVERYMLSKKECGSFCIVCPDNKKGYFIFWINVLLEGCLDLDAQLFLFSMLIDAFALRVISKCTFDAENLASVQWTWYSLWIILYVICLIIVKLQLWLPKGMRRWQVHLIQQFFFSVYKF